MQRADTSPYYANDRWDNGEWSIDGALLGFSFGNVKVNVVGGRTTNFFSGFGSNPANNTSVGGSMPQPMAAGRTDSFGLAGSRWAGVHYGDMDIDQMLGVTASLPLMKDGGLNLAYLWLDTNNPITTTNGNANRTTVFGGDAHFSFGNFLVNAGYSQSNLMYNDTTRIDEDNAAWYANIGLESGRWGANVGYRSIDPLFAAPGDWGRIGMWWNPIDIEGVQASAHLNLSDDIRLSAMAEGYRGRETDHSFMNSDDEIRRYTVGVEYKMASNYDLSFGVEDVRYDLTSATAGSFGNAAGNGGVIERWYDFGFGWALGDNAKFKFLYQVSDYKALELPGFGLPGTGSLVAKGGLITTQLSVKF
jgi:hypothetical protein